jgi:ADP-heptose:LPS heptosyltransferase
VFDRSIKSILAGGIRYLASPGLARAAMEPLFRMLRKPRGAAEIDLARVRSVLVVRLDQIGDLVMTTPFLRELRHNLQDARITLVVGPQTHNLVEYCPYVDEVLVRESRAGGHLRALGNLLSSLRMARRHFWPRRIDLAIVPRWDVDHVHAAFLAYFSGAAWRVGFSEHVSKAKEKLNSGYDALYTHVVKDAGLKHEVQHNLDLITCLGGTVRRHGLEFWPGPADEEYSHGLLKDHGVRPGDRLVGIGPSGGNCGLKQWPTSCFVELGRWLMAEYGVRIMVLGGPEDRRLGRRIGSVLGSAAIDVTGQTTLRQAGALLAECSLYLGGDTGLMHLAASCGTPVVAIFGASCRHRFGPWGRRHRVISALLPCGPCHGPSHIDRCGPCSQGEALCMQSIPTDLVKTAVAQHLVWLEESPIPSTAVPVKDSVLVG